MFFLLSSLMIKNLQSQKMIIKNHPEKQEIKQVWEAGSVL